MRDKERQVNPRDYSSVWKPPKIKKHSQKNGDE